MSCEAFRRRIAQIGGADVLPADIAAHVADCAECAQAVAAERHVRAVLAAAPWPDSPLAQDLDRLRSRAATWDAERSHALRARAGRWAGAAGVLLVLAGLGAWVLRAGDAAPGALPIVALVLLAAGGATWIGLDAAGRRMAAAGAPGRVLLGLSAARAVVAAACVIGLLHPAVLPALEASLWSATGRPAGAGTASVEASVLCAGIADGQLRLVSASEGCRDYERDVGTGFGGATALGLAPGSATGLQIRSGMAVIPAGFNNTSINFSEPMPNAGYHVVLSPYDWGRPFAVDDACRFPIVGARTTSGFPIGVRRCWFEGEDVPLDPVKVDLKVDWIAIETR